MYIADDPSEFDRRFAEPMFYRLLLHKNNRKIVAEVLCNYSAYMYCTWIYLTQANYDLFVHSKDEFDTWMKSVMEKGRKSKSKYLIRYDTEKKISYTINMPEYINNVNVSLFAPLV